MKNLFKSASASGNPAKFIWKEKPSWDDIVTPIVEEKFGTPESQLEILKDMVSGLNEDDETLKNSYGTTRKRLMTNIIRKADSFVYSIEREIEKNQKIELLSQGSKSKINEIIDNFVVSGKKEIVILQEKATLLRDAQKVVPILKGVFERMANMQPLENLQQKDVAKFFDLAKLFAELVESEESFVQNFMPGFVAGGKRIVDGKEIEVNPENGHVSSKENFDKISPENRQIYGLY
ncbi:hypothetical protein HN954_03945 [bacterium]|jgi:hypothetical protein|nr:hypothetical protein [bacterium]MBT6831728.1 hypothetical protein [bacterium]MBT6996551.1 hypothetical protein [bacterium]MBT7772877.1 hypothetical protein [bacterium]